MHIAVHGIVLSQTNGLSRPESVSVNPAHGSCWFADTESGEVVHLATSGGELWRSSARSYRSRIPG